MEGRMARFIQGDRPEAGAELAMTDRELTHLFLRAALAQLTEGKATGDRFAERRGLGGDCTCTSIFLSEKPNAC